MRNIFFILMACTLFVTSCEPTFDEPTASAGNADFSTYVAIGSSYSSGFADGALSKYGQQTSFPALLAQQMQLAGGGAFNIPLLLGDKGTYPDYNTSLPDPFTYTLPRFVLVNEADCKGEVGLAPERLDTIGDNELNIKDDNYRDQIANGTVYHHFGIPAMKSHHLARAGYGTEDNYTLNLPFSPYYWRFANDPADPIFLDIQAAQPTFFTLELGMSDVLAYALDGGIGRRGDRDEDYTAPQRFRGAIDQMLDSLVAHGAQGVIANVPDVTVFPHFTVIEFDALELDQVEVDSINLLFPGIDYAYHVGEHNPFIIEEDNEVRALKSTERIVLGIDIDSLKCLGLGKYEPIGDEYILSEEEIENIRTSIEEYNVIINELAAEHNVPVVDLASFMDEIYDEKPIDGIDYTAEFVSGGFFSLDGLHPTDRGQALIANEFIKVINQHYGAQLPALNPSQYPGVLFP